MKIALIFQGQGSQYEGMGKTIYENTPEGKAIFDQAGEEIKNLCFNSSLEELSKTQNTQPAVFTATMAAYSALEKGLDNLGFSERVYAGFSLGEFSALCACGVLSFSDGLSLVKERSRLMSDVRGKMCASIGGWDKTLEIVKKASNFGVCEAVNFNSPNQIVVAGEDIAIEKFIEFSKESGLKPIPLNVSGPFHSSLLSFVGEKLKSHLSNLSLNPPKYKIYSNVTAKPYAFESMVDLISKQVHSPVLWVDIIKNMVNGEGINLFIEVGPGKTLGSFVKKIERSAKVLTVDDFDSLQKTLGELQNLKGSVENA
ncbi:MAG: ACP S-malonyltransferase [Clostridiaceae bacterium]|nr:ACP S-malonyltransferase [Clostridiaceae bacterium]